MNTDEFFRFLGRLVLTRKNSKKLDETVLAAGKNIDPEIYVGYFLTGSTLLGFLLTFVIDWWPGIFSSLYWGIYSIIQVEPIIVFIFLLIICEVLTYLSLGIIIYVVLMLSIEKRTNAVEEILPDFLMFVSSNVKSGMPLDQAIWYASKPEFGVLSIEVKKKMKKSFGTQNLGESLDELSNAFKSDLFNRTIILLKQAIATGSEIAEVLDRTSEDARNSILLRKEIESSLVLYEIFVLFASMIGTPFLFAVSTKLIAILEKVFARLPPLSYQSQQFFTTIKPSIAPIVTSAEFFWFTLGVLIVTSLFSSFMIGVIRKGSKNQGFKYFPMMIVVSLAVYLLVINLLDMFFTNVLL